MAKFVVAGRADCPYYARAELLADSLKLNVDEFNLHKIVIEPNEWEAWLAGVCKENQWVHNESPIVWRELVDRGGRGVLVGNSGAFEEYIYSYYNMTSSLKSVEMINVAGENMARKAVDMAKEKYEGSLIDPLRVTITGAENPSVYHLVYLISNGDAFGRDRDVSLTLVAPDDSLPGLHGVCMEAVDLASPLLHSIRATSSLSDAMSDTQIVVLLDRVEERDANIDYEPQQTHSWLQRIWGGLQGHVEAIHNGAAKGCRIVVAMDGPVNFLVKQLQESLPGLGGDDIIGLSTHSEQLMRSVLSDRLSVNPSDITDVLVWGGPRGRYDASHAKVYRLDSAVTGPPGFYRPLDQMVHDPGWLESGFVESVTTRPQLEASLLRRPAGSAFAFSVAKLLHRWFCGAPEGQMFSVVVVTDGSSYDLPSGISFSLPVSFTPGRWHPVDNLIPSEALKELANELVREKQLFETRPPTPPSVAEVTSDEKTELVVAGTDGTDNNPQLIDTVALETDIVAKERSIDTIVELAEPAET